MQPDRSSLPRGIALVLAYCAVGVVFRVACDLAYNALALHSLQFAYQGPPPADAIDVLRYTRATPHLPFGMAPGTIRLALIALLLPFPVVCAALANRVFRATSIAWILLAVVACLAGFHETALVGLAPLSPVALVLASVAMAALLLWVGSRRVHARQPAVPPLSP